MASIFREQGGKLHQAAQLIQIVKREHSQYPSVLQAAKEQEDLMQAQSQKR
jgi:hypothetical protein